MQHGIGIPHHGGSLSKCNDGFLVELPSIQNSLLQSRTLVLRDRVECETEMLALNVWSPWNDLLVGWRDISYHVAVGK
jgi:hypothetical protein